MDSEIKKEDEKKIFWIKTGGGKHRLADGRQIKKDQKFLAYEHEISQYVRDIIKPLEPLPSQNEKIESVTKFKIIPASSSGKGGWFNIINVVSGKVMTTKAVRYGEASKLLQDLS